MKNSRGYTLLEAMLVVSILGVVAAMGASLFTRMYQFFNQSDARTEVQRELRVILDDMDRDLRRASAASIQVTEAAGQPPYSKITFATADGHTVTYTQSGHTLTQKVDANTTVLTKNLQYIAFSYPQTDINTVVSISVTLRKATYSGRSTALQMAISKVRVMNP
jgi:prepilin-type N-terminal cleavage/methylation domain-containing protein